MTQSTREARDLITNELEKYLVGPLEPSEILVELPVDFYHVGILYPQETPLDVQEVDESDPANLRGEESSDEADVFDMASSKSQSAMGMTFFVLADTREIKVNVRWGEYSQLAQADDKGNIVQNWQRTQRQPELILSFSDMKPCYQLGRLCLFVRVYPVDNLLAVTLTVAHTESYSRLSGDDRVTKAAFQVYLEAALDADEFMPAPRSYGARSDEEYASYELLYRNQKNYATGHGVAVSWTKSPVTRLMTNWLPSVEVSKASPDILPEAQCLDMKWLAETDDVSAVVNALQELTNAYEDWIVKQNKVLEGVVKAEGIGRKKLLSDAGHKHLTTAAYQLERMRSGINWLRSSEKGFESFRLANRTIATALGWRFGHKKENFKPRWRAFQMGFILSAMQGAAEHDHGDRQIVDLIWFPTGGGKTEAYLGLSALVLFHRMMSSQEPDHMQGVSVITRYTLRLLTLQQFERTASMICAANIVKDQLIDYAAWPDFTLGLFVGSAATPNTLVEAENIRKNISTIETDCTTLPLTRCPVCQEALSVDDQYVVNDESKLITRCQNETCAANRGKDGICIAVVDEHIYAHPPSIVIGTVDKFALMPWKPEIKRLFGQGQSCLPPDLIIQDELHLIGDSLGTMVALYETAIDSLASRSGQPIKIIGSTATIRRAAQQVRKIYDRDVIQFPPSGIDADDSFFYQRDNHNPGRQYIGVMAQGRSPKHTLTWLAGILAQSSTKLSDEVRDPFHTLLLYFNSLRELGGALVLMEDEVKKYITAVAGGDIAPRRISQIKELTSRLRAEELRELLQDMDVPWLPDEKITDQEAVDALLSTNMISVGVDIDRLGIMVMNGQPKSTAEYIQATSRVGRQPGAAGLVVTLYNWSRSRDRSHYERFQDYHQSFYRHVESTSVTPFAPRARDRALHAVLVAMFRCLASEADVKSPKSVVSQKGKALVTEISTIIRARVESIYADDPRLPEFLDDVTRHLDEIHCAWETRTLSVEDNWGNLSPYSRGKTGLLVKPDHRDFDDDPAADLSWRTPTSMREVEQPVNIRLVKSRATDRVVL